VTHLVQELESYNWQLVYALEADPASQTWEERTSAVQWLGLIRLARKYRILIDSRVLRLLRATLLVESTAVRLHHPIDFERQYRKFHRYRAELARRRVTDTLMNQLDGQPNDKLIIRLDRIAQILTGLFFRMRRALALPSVNFNSVVGKWSFAFSILMRFVVQLAAVTGVAGLLTAAGAWLTQATPRLDPAFILGTVFANPLYALVVIVLVFANGRTVLFRLDDKDD